MGYVPLIPNAASLHMVSEICNLLMQCLTTDQELLVEMIASNVTVMVNLVYLLNLDHYGKCVIVIVRIVLPHFLFGR
jgi:hypothetical protein